jgi:hypothetical protein
MNRITLLALTGAVAVAVTVAALGGTSVAGATPPDLLQAAKAASARYHSVVQAERDGYAAASPCVASPAGGMGIHYENPQLMADPALDPLRPEILVYAPRQDGRLELVAIEYWRADADGSLATDADRPSLFGVAFDGPMPGHSPVMPVHYDLHVWLWQANDNGLFTAFNPGVSCP